MWYFGDSGGGFGQIGYATSPDGRVWTKRGVVLTQSIPQDSVSAAYAEVLKVGNEYKMWYAGYDGSNYRILYANSSDGIVWAKHGVVLDVGPPGSGEDYFLFSPTVLYEAGTYRMWYSGRASGSPQAATFYATSADGVSWARRGVVLSWGPGGSFDSIAVADASVVRIGARLEMVYCGVSSSPPRLMYARSSDGENWTKLGVILVGISPLEDLVCGPNVFVEPDGSWKVFYHARGSGLQIFLAARPSTSGWVRSTPIALPAGAGWSQFTWTGLVPQNTSIRVTVRDASLLSPLPGMENVSATSVDLSGVGPAAHPRIVLEARLAGDGIVTPQLDSWEVTWTTPGSANPLLSYWWAIAILVAAVIVAVALVLWRRGRQPAYPVPPSPGSLPPRP